MLRRDFLSTSTKSLAALSILGLPTIAWARKAPTIQEVIDHIKARIPGDISGPTVDTVKSGDPSKQVTGIATTFMATIPVIREAISHGVNLIITHEPTFYNNTDETDWLAGDPVYAYKRALLEDNGIVVWRFHDFWHRHDPDGIMTGFYRQLGWADKLDPEVENVCNISPTPLRQLAARLEEKLSLNRVFFVGNADMSCQRVGCLPGAWGLNPQVSLLQKDIDVLVIGETREWETSEYVRDAAAAGLSKGLIILGHADSEEPGMVYCRDWVQAMFPEIRCMHLKAGDAFQRV